MTRKTLLTLFIMILLPIVAIWENALRYYPFLLGFSCVVVNGIRGKVTFSECGLNPLSVGILLKKGAHRKLFFCPLIVVAAEIFIGRMLFEHFSEYAIALIDEYLIFNNSATLILFTVLLIVIEEIPWRCHFQLHIGRHFPNGWALLLPAVSICVLAMPSQISAVSVYCLLGIFMRRLLWGMLYESAGSLWMVVLSHFLAVMFYLIVLVGL